MDLLTPPSDRSHASPPPDNFGNQKYEELGLELLQSMKCYGEHLKKDCAPSPSLSPSMVEDGQASPSRETARERVVELAQQILGMTMDPRTNLLINSLSFHFCSCLKVAVDLRIAEYIPKHGQVSLGELSTITGAQETLLARIMRVLISKHVFAEAQPGVYRHTTISWAICEPDQSHLLKHRLDDCFRSASRQADSLRLNGYREPELGDRCGFSLAFQSDASFWEYITKHDPVRGENFNKAMKSVQINSLSDIPNLYPFDSLAETGGLIVDVGGGHGQVSRAILASYPNSYLRCVVQDRFVASLPTADANGSQTSEVGKVGTGSVTFEKHNFFDPQPIKGAAAYFFRHIFHDWPDSACREILKQTVLAMDTQSRILICDQIVDEKSSSVHSILYDLDMMSLFGGKERRLSEWEALITEADKRLRITDTKKSSNSPTTILEIRLG